VGFDREIMAAIGISSGYGGFRLLEELADLIQQFQLVGAQRLPGGLIEILLGRGGELLG